MIKHKIACFFAIFFFGLKNIVLQKFSRFCC